MGDGVLVYFGYPQAHEDDAERAVRAGFGLSCGHAVSSDSFQGSPCSLEVPRDRVSAHPPSAALISSKATARPYCFSFSASLRAL